MKCNRKTKAKHLLLFVVFSLLLLSFIGCENDNQTDSNDDTSLIDPDNSDNNNNDGVSNNPSDENTDVSPSDSPTFNKTALTVSKYTYCSDFRDGYAYVAFEKNGTDYGAIIDTNGIITYKVPCSDYSVKHDWKHLGNGLFYIELDSVGLPNYVLDKNGNVFLSSEKGDFSRVVAGDTVHLVIQEKSTVTEVSYYYGVFDSNKNWILNMTECEDYYLNFTGYLADGIFTGGEWDDFYILDTKSGKILCLKDFRYTEMALINDTIYIRQCDGGIYDALKDETTDFPYYEDIALKMDGTFEEVTEFPYSSTPDQYGKILNKDGAYLTITDVNKGTTITYKDYPLENIVRVIPQENYTVIGLSGDGGNYFTVIDENGNQRFDPIKIKSFDETFMCTEDKVICYAGNYASDIIYTVVYSVVDGEIIINSNKEYDIKGFYDGISSVYKGDYYNYRDVSYYFYINSSGETILTTLYE